MLVVEVVVFFCIAVALLTTPIMAAGPVLGVIAHAVAKTEIPAVTGRQVMHPLGLANRMLGEMQVPVVPVALNPTVLLMGVTAAALE